MQIGCIFTLYLSDSVATLNDKQGTAVRVAKSTKL